MKGVGMEPRDLLEAARSASQRAYAPYSKFHVGAAIQTEDETIHVGCNVENASYGLSMCAERNAVAKMFPTRRTSRSKESPS